MATLAFLDEIDDEVESVCPIATTTIQPHEFQFQTGHLRVLQMNIRSLNANFDQFMVLLSTFRGKFDVVVLTETWRSGGDGDGSSYSIPGYHSHYTNTQINQNDGVAIFVRTELDARVSQPVIYGSSALLCTFVIGGKPFNLLGIYRPPSQSPSLFNEALSLYLANNNLQCDTIITGDFNLDILASNPTVDALDYKAILTTAGFSSAINNHTRIAGEQKTCLDHFFTTEATTSRGYVIPTSVTDHYAIALSTACQHVNAASTTVNGKIQKVVNHTELSEYLSSEPWHNVLGLTNVNQCANNFIFTLQRHILSATEFKIITNRKFKIKKWMTNGLLTSLRHRDKMRLQSDRRPNDDTLRNTYTRYRNYLQTLIRLTKNTYYKTQLDVNAGNMNKSYKIINEITDTATKKHTISSLLTENGEVKNNEPKKMADILNNYFAAVGETLASSIPRPVHPPHPHTPTTRTFNNPHTMQLTPVHLHEVSALISSLSAHSAPGPDDIPSDILKRHSQHLVQPLTYLINLCFEMSTFPEIFKQATVIPVYKNKGAKNERENYRPISLTSNVSKIIEKAIKLRILSFLDRTHYLSNNQFGFRAGRCTQDAIAKFTSRIHHDLDNGNHPLAIFLDLCKAFDTVSHPLLTQKLEQAGLRGHVLDLLTSYLNLRTQRVRLNTGYIPNGTTDADTAEHSVLSDIADVTYGVPQGTVLGPLLFIIYINNLLELDLDCSMIGFADDTVVYVTGQTWADSHSKASTALQTIKKWLDNNLLTLNLTKTEYMTFSYDIRGQPTGVTVRLHGDHCSTVTTDCVCPTVNKATHYKYLGVIIDQHLKWDRHCHQTSNRIRRTMYKFRRLRHILTPGLLRQVYFALVQSIVEYAVLIWGGAYTIHINRVEIALRGVLRVALAKPYDYPHDHLYRDMDVPTLTHTYAKQLIYYRLTNRTRDDYVRHGLGTRFAIANNLRQLLPLSSHFKTSFVYKSIELFNTLPNEIKQLPSYSPKNIFKAPVASFIASNYPQILYLLRLRPG